MTDCIFCKLVLGEIPAQTVYQDESVVAFRDLNPHAPVHVLVVPRKHFAGFGDAAEEDEQLLGHVARTAARVAQLEGIGESGFRCVVNSGEDAQQTVHHLHLHVLGGRKMSWPPG
ncbi:MAG: histidine triad nucleotide-binding protein [Chloroflexota bacterium]|nr:histidine triad nucleotide-binding protein [Chloroflexota bacterium]